MKTFFVDANAFLRFFLNDIPKQKKEFESLLNQAKESKVKWMGPQIVIFEINFILQKYYEFQKEDIIDKLQTIVEAPYLQISEVDVLRASLKLYSKSNLSLTDCFIYCSAENSNAELFTFDKKLKRLHIAEALQYRPKTES